MAKAFRISDKGKEALRNSEPLEPECELLLTMMASVPSIGQDNLLALMDQAIRIYGSPENALEAFQSGEFAVEKIATVH